VHISRVKLGYKDDKNIFLFKMFLEFRRSPQMILQDLPGMLELKVTGALAAFLF